MTGKTVLQVLDEPNVIVQGKQKNAVWHTQGEKMIVLGVAETYEHDAINDARIGTELERCQEICEAAGVDFAFYLQAGLGQMALPAPFQYQYRSQQAAVPADEDVSLIRPPRLIPFSGTALTFPLGEGLLDFLYADFAKAAEDVIVGEEEARAFCGENEKEQLLYDGLCMAKTVKILAPVLAPSVYTMAFPPFMVQCKKEELSAYLTYLKALQEKLSELLEFVYDRDFYPKVLGDLSENERYAYYCRLMKCDTRWEQRYYIDYPNFARYPLVPLHTVGRLAATDVSSDPEVLEFYERFHTSEYERIYNPFGVLSPVEAFECGTVEELLMFEFWQMMKEKTQLRRCKRCGRFFIMKGNYDTNYCDRIPEGETRNCQQLAAQDNYKKKMADNAAIPLYQKYYKRYAARLRVNQIKPDQFKKWKFEAMTKRDACSDGKITVEEYENWLEGCFPNRKKK